MRGKIYTIVSQENPLTQNHLGGSQYNAYSRVQVAEAIQCQKQYRHYVVVLLLAFCFMLSFETYKKSLGERAKTLTDSQIEELRTLMYKLSNGLFDRYLRKVNTSVMATKVVQHKQDGNCVTVFIFAPVYA